MNSANREFQEKRNFIRMKIDTPAEIELIDGETVTKGVCRDLSGGGMLVELDTALPEGTELRIRICSGHGHAPMIEALTKVTRVVAQPHAEPSTCLIGLEIHDVLNK